MGSALDHVTWWEGNYYPGAGEVVAWREHRGHNDAPHRPNARGQREGRTDAAPPEGNPERAIRRARTRIRRYAAGNLLNRLIVLTWSEQESDLTTAKRHVRQFVRYGLRVKLGYKGPYVIGWERHKSGNWHANVLVGKWIKHGDLERAWGRGFVWISRFRGSGGRDGARRAARYVAKYVAKDLDGAAPAGGHRYEIAQGFAVRVVRVYGTSPSSILDTLGRAVVYRWDSMESPEPLRGPPVVWAALAEGKKDRRGVASV